jgi:hypothetical protein
LFPGYQLVARVVSGGIAGGVVSQIYGGNFWQGFAQGAATAGAAFLFNCMLHPDRQLENQAVQGEGDSGEMNEAGLKPRGYLLGGGPGGYAELVGRAAGATIVGYGGAATGTAIGMKIGFAIGGIFGLGAGPLGSLGGAIVFGWLGGAAGGVIGGWLGGQVGAAAGRQVDNLIINKGK